MNERDNQIVAVCHEISRGAATLAPLVEETRALVELLRDDSSATSTSAAYALFHVKNAHAELDDVIKALYHVRDFLDKVVVPARMDAEGTDMVRIPELARSFSKQNKMSASFLDKEAGFKWLRDLGQGDLIQETVNAGTLASFVRNLITEQGIDPPEDVVKVTTYSTTSINKYTPK